MLMERVPCDLSSLFSLTRSGTVPEFSTFWIKNLLIPYLIGGNAKKADGKEGLDSINEAASGKDSPACE
jgi:hypothetical protein